MHDVNRRAGDLRHGNRAMHGFSLGERGPGERVIDGRGLSSASACCTIDVDDAAVFGMHADERAVLRGLLQRLEDGRVVDHQHVRIGHEELEAGHAFAHHVVHVFEADVPDR